MRVHGQPSTFQPSAPEVAALLGDKAQELTVHLQLWLRAFDLSSILPSNNAPHADFQDVNGDFEIPRAITVDVGSKARSWI